MFLASQALRGLGIGRGIMNDANLQACSRRTGLGNGFLPSSCRAIFRGASTLASTIRSAGYSVASTITSTDEDHQCEQVYIIQAVRIFFDAVLVWLISSRGALGSVDCIYKSCG